MRANDADALMEELKSCHFPGAPYVDAGISIAIGKVCDAPAIEPEHKTGNWVGIDDEPCEDWECNRCGEVVTNCGYDVLPNFCPHCGADMRGEQYK